MQPKHAHCNRCHAKLRFFTEDLPKNCPTCGSLLRVEEFGSCKVCKTKLMLGVEMCEGCKLQADPQYQGQPPSSPGTSGSVN